MSQHCRPLPSSSQPPQVGIARKGVNYISAQQQAVCLAHKRPPQLQRPLSGWGMPRLRHLPRQQVYLGGHSGGEQAQGAMRAPQECQVVSAASCHSRFPVCTVALQGCVWAAAGFHAHWASCMRLGLQHRLCCSRPHVHACPKGPKHTNAAVCACKGPS